MGIGLGNFAVFLIVFGQFMVLQATDKKAIFALMSFGLVMQQ